MAVFQAHNFLGIEERYCYQNNSYFEIIPIPYERTTSYGKGTSKGPEAIIEASQYVELYDEQFQIDAYKKGIHTSEPIDVSGQIKTAFDRIQQKFSLSLKEGKFPIGLGGEHAVTFPIYTAFHNFFDDLCILHFDAHSDLRESYEGSIYSHASVMHRIAGLGDPIIQVGIRSQCIEEARFIRDKGIHTFYAHHIVRNGFNQAIIDHLNRNVFITFDLDFFDPSIMPSTGTPEPGGFQWHETVVFLQRVFEQKNVVGFDVVELAPQKNVTHPDFLAAKLIYKMMTLKLCLNFDK
ncbi:MAG: agmatinase [Calditrichaceae bacterium]|nr:agmatinase [Calditrichaceae bacterium]